MAASLNRAQLIGNLTKDPEARKTTAGKDVCSFSLATNSSWKDASGEKHDEAEYHNIVVWGKLSEICVQYLKKGQKIFAEGALKTRNWEGADGTKHTRTEIVLDNMVMLGSKGAPSASPMPNTENNADLGGYGAQYTNDDVQPENDDSDKLRLEDIPFN